ncbi:MULTISPECIES: maleylpyruvate isomerase N-terminal domain-containing protein [Streptomyces]|uniref:maleylpyruvate isomerase N-terminal domain-containing protein n=1 Tax=Streptomyces TaxID=1883 RepID=UPI0002DB4D0F|nr:maleylpyruvate isomerase N-terminal domain-containing protein [Streptomyces sp. AA1529]
MDLFACSWTALRTAVAALPEADFEKPSGCAGWLVRDLVCHLVIDAQDVLITLATPTGSEPTADAVTYWEVADRPRPAAGPGHLGPALPTGLRRLAHLPAAARVRDRGAGGRRSGRGTCGSPGAGPGRPRRGGALSVGRRPPTADRRAVRGR